MHGRAVSALEGNTHTASDDSGDHHGEFELLYATPSFRRELHHQVIVTRQSLFADDNAAAIGTLDREKQTAWAKVLDLTRAGRAALDAYPGVYLQCVSYVLTPFGAGRTAVFI